MIASGANKFNEERRRALLLHCLGPEGQRVYNTLPSTTPQLGDSGAASADGATSSYDETFARLDKHFSPAVNVVAERYKFRQRSQRLHELVDDYISALRELALNCEFGNFRDEFIRDQLVEKTTSDRIRERLLIEPALTLQTALTIARQIESAVRDARVIDASTSAHESVNVVGAQSQPSYKKQQQKRKQHGPRQQTVSRPNTNTTVECFRCGNKYHKANDPTCKAREAICNSCGKKGHFSKVCKSRSQSTAVHQISEEQSQSFEILSTGIHPTKDAFLFGITLNDSAQLDMVFDTGSPVSIIPIEVFDKHFAREALLPPKAVLTTFLRNEIPVIGMFTANVSHRNLLIQQQFFIVERGTCIMGRDLMDQLHVLPKLPEKEVKHINAAEFKDLFSGRVGLAKGYVHRVKVKPEVPPVAHKLRRLPFALRDKVSAELARLETADIIEKVDASEWISPLVVVHKKSGDIRLCVDLRSVNKAIVEDKFPLPNIQDLFAELRGATVFSSLDLASAYHQLLLHEDSRDMTTFITHEGLFRFKRVCFGLCSAPSAFQKLMSSVLRGLSGVQCYLDDVVVYGATQAEHDLHLNTVLERLQSVGLSLNTQKCQFNLAQIRYLGHIVSAKGMEPDPSHVEAIRNAPVPTEIGTIRSFLGLASYYSRFVPHFSTITEPLRELTRKDVPFAWTPEVQQAFDTVKEVIANSVTLHLFDPDLPVVVATDASAYGLGAVLLQEKEGVEVPVAFASRTLSGAERNYSVGEKEALACVWACEKWFQYIWGRHFTLRTDHQSLTTLLSSRGSGRQTMRIARWATRLMRFNYTVEYCPGAQNCAADALSRLPLPTEDAIVDDDSEIVIQAINTIFAGNSVSKAELQQATADDSILSRVISHVMSRWPHKVEDSMIPYKRLRDELSVIDNCLFRGERLVIPSQLQAQLINCAHSAHQGIVRTKQRLRDIYWWPGMDRMVEDAIHHCGMCQSSDKVAKTSNTPLQPVQLPSGPWKKLGIDITGPFDSTHDCKYAIVLIDYYSKWVELAFVAEVTTKSVITFLMQIFAREGLPDEIVSDNGTQFVSIEFEAFLAKMKIRHLKSSLYYPRANGEVERWNRVLKQTLQIAKNEQKPRKEATVELLMAYRATPHQTTGKSPAELLHGRKIVTPVNIRDMPESAPDDADIRARVSQQQEKSRKYTDKKRSAKEPPFHVGDYVRVRSTRKGGAKFSAPKRIIGKKGCYTFQLEDNRVWNASKLTLYRDHIQSESRSRHPNESLENPSRPKRNAQKPVWSHDYDM